MRTTINIRDDLIQELLVRSKAKNKSKAIEAAIKQYIGKKAVEDLISLSGKMTLIPTAHFLPGLFERILRSLHSTLISKRSLV